MDLITNFAAIKEIKTNNSLLFILSFLLFRLQGPNQGPTSPQGQGQGLTSLYSTHYFRHTNLYKCCNRTSAFCAFHSRLCLPLPAAHIEWRPACASGEVFFSCRASASKSFCQVPVRPSAASVSSSVGTLNLRSSGSTRCRV